MRPRLQQERLSTSPFFFLLSKLWSRHVKPSSAKGEETYKAKQKIPKCVQAEALPESESCTSLRIAVHARLNYAIQRNTALRKNLPETLTANSVHHGQRVELRREIASGSTIADSEAA